MNITLNQQPLALTKPLSVHELFEQQAIHTATVAVAYNGRVLHREAWATTVLQDNDQLVVFQAVAGG